MSRKRDLRRRLVNTFSKTFIALQKAGIRTGRAQILTTTGRRSGQPRTQPVGVVPIDGQRYIFQAYPRAAWVANARTTPTATLSSGRHTTAVRLTEVALEERRALLRQQMREEPGTAKLLVHSGLVSEPTPEAVAAASERIAVFRIDAAVTPG